MRKVLYKLFVIFCITSIILPNFFEQDVMAISNNRFAENISVDNGNVLNGLVPIGAKQHDLFSANGDNSYIDDLYGREFPYYGVELAKKSLGEIIKIMGGNFDVKWANDVVYAPGSRIYVSNENVLPGMRFFIGDATRLFDSGEYGNDINIALTKIKKDILDGKYKKFDYVNIRQNGILDNGISPGMKYIDFCEVIGGYPPARVGGQSEISNVGQYVKNFDDDLDFVLALYDYVDVDYNEEVPVATMKKLNPSINQFIVQSKNSGQNITTEDNTIRFTVKSLKLGVKEKYNLKNSLIPKNKKARLSWSSSNNAIATVSNKGNVVGKKTGSAVITVKNKKGARATVRVHIKKAPTSVAVAPIKLTIGKDETAILSRQLNKDEFSNKMIWTSSNPKVATVKKISSAKAKVVAKKCGTVKIKVKTYNKKTAVCRVKIIDRKAYVFKNMVTYNNKTYFDLPNATIYDNSKINRLPEKIRNKVSSFTIKDNYIYYIQYASKDKKTKIYRSNMNGDNRKLIVSNCYNSPSEVTSIPTNYIMLGRLYYKAVNKKGKVERRVLNLKTHKPEKLSKNYRDPQVIDKGIGYYIKNNAIYTYNHLNRKSKKLTSTDDKNSSLVSYIFGVSKNNVYFYSMNDYSIGYGIGKVNINSKKTSFIRSSSMERTYILKGKYIFTTDSATANPEIKRFTFSNKKVETIKRINFENLIWGSIVDGDRYILCNCMFSGYNEPNNSLYMLSQDGKFFKKIADY